LCRPFHREFCLAETWINTQSCPMKEREMTASDWIENRRM
jgi:hypothetical protein